MGFMDKAKKMAEQAQAKLDEVQDNFNKGQSGGSGDGGDGQKFDQHGRPVADPAAPPADVPTQQEPAKVEGDPLLSEEPPMAEPPEEEPKAPAPPPSGGTPGMTSGDPLG